MGKVSGIGKTTARESAYHTPFTGNTFLNQTTETIGYGALSADEVHATMSQLRHVGLSYVTCASLRSPSNP
ncbi:hypothetical protein [Sabulibacter ruber]|uniref:hypothetical protein n=1 Tax=Sabulibacter ruber TaxID=2811901 RepID=UPI001A96BF5E|nr:hypothetical protein [Sabulibacter ruber]